MFVINLFCCTFSEVLLYVIDRLVFVPLGGVDCVPVLGTPVFKVQFCGCMSCFSFAGCSKNST